LLQEAQFDRQLRGVEHNADQVGPLPSRATEVIERHRFVPADGPQRGDAGQIDDAEFGVALPDAADSAFDRGAREVDGTPRGPGQVHGDGGLASVGAANQSNRA